jgi:hypothetical protein
MHIHRTRVEVVPAFEKISRIGTEYIVVTMHRIVLRFIRLTGLHNVYLDIPYPRGV